MQFPFRLLSWIPAAVAGLALAAPPAAAPTDAYLDGSRARWEEAADAIWDYSETSLAETRSAALLEKILEEEGFSVSRGVAGMPTAFAASAGSGPPVVGILAEYDALPGLSQKGNEAKKSPRVSGAPGHGCGHNLLGTATVAAAVAANRARIAGKLPGTIRVFGTPAEEELIGKPFMLLRGVFAGTDVVLAWHPAAGNYVVTRPRLAITAIDVEFFGKTAHAAANPWLGRSSLDAVELFDHALALMREHIYPTARIHRVIKDGG
ncbi:MAG: amidohydrolase, partial [Acidithiobacillales bacterium]